MLSSLVNSFSILQLIIIITYLIISRLLFLHLLCTSLKTHFPLSHAHFIFLSQRPPQYTVHQHRLFSLPYFTQVTSLPLQFLPSPYSKYICCHNPVHTQMLPIWINLSTSVLSTWSLQASEVCRYFSFLSLDVCYARSCKTHLYFVFFSSDSQ